MNIPSKEKVNGIKARYPKGTRIQLAYMDDERSPLGPGDEGVVTFVDDMGNIHMNWDCGSTLALIEGVDRFAKI